MKFIAIVLSAAFLALTAHAATAKPFDAKALWDNQSRWSQ